MFMLFDISFLDKAFFWKWGGLKSEEKAPPLPRNNLYCEFDVYSYRLFEKYFLHK